jgi:NitT/TauT family transport system ATP-binding protein
MADDASLLTLAHVTRRFGETLVLDDISFEVKRGGITALIGASGSGKTTLLRLIARLVKPGSGEIESTQSDLRIGYVFQQAALMPWATVADNVALPQQLDGRRDDKAVAQALASVGLADRAAARPHELSGGQQMRVSIARALASSPDLLLLDEPFAALDEITRQNLCNMIAGLNRSLGLTMVFVTHNISEAVFVADTILLLSSRPGRVAALMAVQAPAMRDAAFRASGDFARQCETLSRQLAETFA